MADLAGATRLFREVLDGQLGAGNDDTTELTWPGGKRIRLVREDGLPLGGSLHHVRFTRADGAFSTQDTERTALLAKRLGLTVELASPQRNPIPDAEPRRSVAGGGASIRSCARPEHMRRSPASPRTLAARPVTAG